MNTLDSRELLGRFAEEGSEEAFAELVARYANLVHSVAVRRTGGNRDLAQDIAQKVFADFARQGRQLPPDTLLGGWLHRHTCFVASTVMRSETRRTFRERQAAMNSILETPDHFWNDLAPLVDQAIDELSAPDRDALVLRYFEQQNLRRIGQALGTSEDAAQKRVSRALEKLKQLLEQKGVALSLATLGAALDSQAVAPAPDGLATELARSALRTSVRPAGLAAGFLALLPSSTIKLAAVLLVGGLVVGGRWWQQSQDDTTATPTSSPAGITATVAPVQPAEASPAPPVPPAVEPRPNGSVAPAGNALQLTLLAADSGKPLPNVEIDYQALGDSENLHKTLITTRAGVCAVPLPRTSTTGVRLTTRTEGFADTRLCWLPSQGDTIPPTYTVRVIRAARISGHVVDGSGQPVAGAKIGIGYRDDPLLDTGIESHLFGWIGTTTDVDGSWSVHRIAPLMIRRLDAAASHPEYTRSDLNVSNQKDAEKQLRDGTHVFRLGEPATVRGVVVDPSGSPVGNARVLVGWLDEVSSRKSRTENDGTFSIRGCKPGKTYVTAEAEGFAPTTEQIEVTVDTPAVRLALEMGRRLVLRVINYTNQPVAGASVFLRRDDDESIRGSARLAPVQAELPQTRTDTNGQLIWSNAPTRDKLLVDVSRRGYLRRDFVPVRPDGTEQVIRMGSALTIAGTVRDADSGALLPDFRIVLGWPESDRPRWSSLSRHWLTFRDGTFRHTLEEPILSGTKDPQFVVKIEAAGHTPAVSRVIRSDEGEVQLNVSLQRLGEQSVTVYEPNGRPAAAAEVGLVSNSSGLVFGVGGWAREASLPGTLLRTDAQGKFELPSEAEVGTNVILITHESGCVEVAPAALTSDRRIQLASWGRIEGRYVTNGVPVQHQTLRLNFIGRTTASVRSEMKAVTDAGGRFRFEQAPPGRLTLNLVVPYPPVQPTSWGYKAIEDVEVASGQTVQVELGGRTYAFTLQFRWPEGVEPDPGWQTFASLQTLLRPIPGWPLDSLEAFDLARKTAGTCRTHLLTRHAAGHWTANEVCGGRHLVQVRVQSTTPDRRPVWQAVGNAWIDLPPAPPEAPIDLGEIVLQRP